MSILNITYTDFGKGKFELHKGMYEQQKINEYIDKYERLYLINLLGGDLFNLFVADLVAGGQGGQGAARRGYDEGTELGL